ncbi:Sec20-domain-containing protein [Cylindrobasidium torrendii FP15055 ss-10]|uniref:Sec20-domain-containing protein n=1 Tax=Cylindrobasidium torrendii FP15055 ss-10 TaxID=1314674 RepID=A0A0D7ATH9_9AGAR|nr:Sec20-domain-containing protein [Cylindrobasidium torrendii FP15055 ss-10]
MPPVPPTFSPEAVQLIDSIERRFKDVREYQIPRLRAFKGTLGAQQDLATEVREDIDTVGRLIESLELSVGDLKSARDRNQLQHLVDGFTGSLAAVRREYRTALLESKRAIDSMSKSNREELLKSNVASKKYDEKSTGDLLMKANNDVTDALQRTIGLMQGELEKSVLSTQMLESSTATLRSTSATHDTLTNVMGTSKQLITALEKADWMDRMLIMAALLFFILVVLFIIKQRLVDRGVRIAFWWTRFLPGLGSDPDDALLEKLEKGVRTTLEVAPSVLTSLAAGLTASGTTGTTAQATENPATVEEEEPSPIDTALSTQPSDSVVESEDARTLTTQDAVYVHEEL